MFWWVDFLAKLSQLLVIKKVLKTQEEIFSLIFVGLLQNYLKCLKQSCLKMLKTLEDTMEEKLQK